MFRCQRNIKGKVSNLLKGKLAPCHPDRIMWARKMCKNCYSKWLKKHNPTFAVAQKENVTKWMKLHKKHRQKYLQSWALKRDPNYNRIRALRKYGMTLDDYDDMLKKQSGVCFVCHKPPKNGKNLHVDHDHETGYVRGLLCFRCNFGLSFFGENKEVISRLNDYMNGI